MAYVQTGHHCQCQGGLNDYWYMTQQVCCDQCSSFHASNVESTWNQTCLNINANGCYNFGLMLI